MKQYFYFHAVLLLLCAAMMLACSSYAGHESKKNSLQNTTKASAYFEEYLNFTTNPYAISALLKNKEDILILDVRDAHAFDNGHIPTAINVPYGTKVLSLKQLDSSKFTYVYCYNELCNLAVRVAKDLAEAGYPVKVIRGGFDEWKKQGFVVEKQQSKKIAQ